ncbi:endothelin-converting enzyme 2-like [Dermacentor andersoni]|uniref:endothelin-converting enzyme 2-like n=1 Tax=Dermacentor andersoni TaxID=34620 RepID=UPI003B3B30EB
MTKIDVVAITTACVTTCLILVLFYVNVVGLWKKSASGRNVCATEDCVSHATLLTRYIDWKLDPCDDFEAFVCSGWERSREYRDMVRSTFDALRYAWYGRFEDLLRRGSLRLSAGRKPLAMYQMCRWYYPSNASQVAFFRNFIEDHGLRWPEPPDTLLTPLYLVAALSYLWQSPFWITVGLLRHPHSTGSRRRVLIGPGAYLRIMRYHRRVVERSYVRYWEELLALFYPEESERPPRNDTVVDELGAMEKDVLDKLHAVNVSPRKKPALFPFRDIGVHVPNASTEHWLDVFQDVLSLEPKLGVDDEIAVTDLSLLRVVARLLASYTRLQLNRYFAWLIVQYCSPVADFSFLVSFYGSKSKAEAYLRTSCAHTVEAAYKVLVLALGISTLFTARDREVIEAGFDSLVSAAVRKVNESGWMDDYSKSRAIEKLESAREAMWPSATLLEGDTLEATYAGFPEHEPSLAHYWMETRKAMKSMNRTPEYTEALLLPGGNFPDYISYDYVSNVVKLAIAAAAPPAYYRNGTHAMLYGGLLFLVAKQLVKAIDDEGIKWAPNAVVEQMTFLSNSTLEVFRTKTECRRGDENEAVLPDVPALEITYAALGESHLRGEESVPLALDAHLPEDKVFFMTLCYLSCAKPGDWNPIPADCNKVVRNSPAFAKAYKCREGSKMNPVKKCAFFA